MTLTPEDIEAQVFREKFKGYDQDEVDAFLDRVSDRIAELLKEREELSERMRSVEADARESIEAERLLKRTLITAQRTADETVAEAVTQAQAQLAEADQRAAQVLSDAERRAQQIVADAERNASDAVAAATREVDAQRAAAEQQLRQVQTAVAELQRFRSEYRDRVRAAVAEQLAMLDSVGDVPDLPPEMARLAAEPPPAQAAPASAAPEGQAPSPASPPASSPEAPAASPAGPESAPAPAAPDSAPAQAAPSSALDVDPHAEYAEAQRPAGPSNGRITGLDVGDS